jgi:hypothetical protein
MSPQLGGQGLSSMDDYFGQRALAQQNMITDLMNAGIAQRNTDEQNAIANALGTGNFLYGMDRGNFADQLSLMGFNQTESQNIFNNLLSAMGFQSDTTQQDFANQLAISDRTSQDYMDALNAYWGQTTDSQGMNDAALQTWANYLSGTEVDPNSMLNALTWLTNSQSDIYRTGIQAQADSDPYSMLMTVLGSAFGNMFQPAAATTVSPGNTTVSAPDMNWLGDLIGRLGDFGGGGVDIGSMLPNGISLGDFWGTVGDVLGGASAPDWLSDTLGDWGVTTPWGSAGANSQGTGDGSSGAAGAVVPAALAYGVGSSLPNALNMPAADAQAAVDEYLTGKRGDARYNMLGQANDEGSPLSKLTDFASNIALDLGFTGGTPEREAVMQLAVEYWKNGNLDYNAMLRDIATAYPTQFMAAYNSTAGG